MSTIAHFVRTFTLWEFVQAHWLTPEELQQQADRHRSPLVWQVVQDYLGGRRSPLSLLRHVP